jgi:23S rRNA pseudouridine2605 synthase
MKDSDKPRTPGRGPKKHGDFSKFTKKKSSPTRRNKDSKVMGKRFRDEVPEKEERPKWKKDSGYNKPQRKKDSGREKPQRKKSPKPSTYVADGGLIRLNKYIANSGVCSRREADTLIVTGVVKVNDEIVTELGTKVKPSDKVTVGEQTLKTEKHKYVLLNKPKGYITTTDDPLERKTVMVLVEKACKERIYPVGRLDRSTLGLLLFTNDGELAKKMTHPKHNIKKTYHVFLDKPLAKNDLVKISEGINLEDGMVKPDAVAYVGDGADRKSVGIELHSGKNRIVRRIFESLGYQVVKLDRVFLAGLTKKDLPRGRWRHLTEEEVNILKMIK